MSRSMVDIDSVTAEIRPEKPRKKNIQDENIMSASATPGGRSNFNKYRAMSSDFCHRQLPESLHPGCG